MNLVIMKADVVLTDVFMSMNRIALSRKQWIKV